MRRLSRTLAGVGLLVLASLAATPAFAGATPLGGDPPRGCPAATPAQASGATPGVPTAVHAIGGNASVTVSWCPPAQGQADVTSYTVTSSTGQQVTATVPNDYVIIDGLANGSSYSFTVHANTPSSSGQESTSSNTVIPIAIPEPQGVLRGKPQTVSYDQFSMIIGGKRTIIYSGEFDPWRLPSPSLWLDRLEKMKADGFNAVTVYFDWDYSSPAAGVYDFTGVTDMNEFLNMAQEAGLYVIARPGPYINAETDGGGFPGWLVTQSGTARTDAADYEAAAFQWLSEIDPIIAAHQVTRGGDVILYQVENELWYKEPATVQYMQDLEAKARADGIDVPLAGNLNQTFAGTPAEPNIDGYDSYPLGFDCSNTTAFGTPPTFAPTPGMPLMLPEFQGGSYDPWGGTGYANCYALTGPGFENVFYKSNIADGVTIQGIYMTVGGTDWGWLPAPFMYTSYDYGSAIAETGEIGTPANPDDITGSKFGENKLIGDFVQAVPSLAKTESVAAPATDSAAVTATARANPDDGTQLIYLSQSDSSSTTPSSAHLALQSSPSFAYTYDDSDPALSYAGTWFQANTSNSNYTGGDYAQTESWSTTTGSSMSVTFNGTAVSWIAPTNTNGGIAAVVLDGTQVATVDTYNPAGKQVQQVLFQKSGLSPGAHTLQIVVTGNQNPASSGDTVVIDAIDVPSAAEQADFYAVVPQQPGTSITLEGHDAKLLLTNFAFAGEQLQYSTSELMTQMQLGGEALALLYGPAGTDGETVLRYQSQPTVTTLRGSVSSTWDETRGDLRLDYVHNGLAEVKVTGGGRPPLLLLLGDTTTAEQFWPEQTAAGPALVRGSYLVRTATAAGATLRLAGDTSTPGPLTVWASPAISAVTWNGSSLTTASAPDGSLTSSLPGPSPQALPALTGWRFSFEAPEIQPGFDDGSWVLADHTTTTNPTAPITLPVLYADDYGFHQGFIWYRGHFTATGNETGITLTAGEGTHGAFSVWLNGAFLGSNTAGSEQAQQTFAFPAGTLRPGQDNVISVLVQSSGHDEDGAYNSPPADSQKSPRGLLGASLGGASTPVTWRLEGTLGGEHLQDPVRGSMNATGLYGTNHGWDLPGYPDSSWQQASLPDSWAARGLPPGIGWYRTTFNLALPTDTYTPVAVQLDGPGPGPGTDAALHYRAFIFVNGWLIGQYDNALGPQHKFYVPAGLLDESGANTIAIGSWGLDNSGGGLGAVRLVAAGTQAGGLPVTRVHSPGYEPFVYGLPARSGPTLGVISSTALITAGQPLRIRAVLRNPGMQPLQDATISLDLPPGWTAAPATPEDLGTVAPGGSATGLFRVTPPASLASAGQAGIVADAAYRQGLQYHTLLGATELQIPYQSLQASFDNAGITSDSDTNPAPDFPGFDGGGTTYSAEGLTAAGLAPGATVPAGGLGFTWPSVPAAQPDNTMAMGQLIRVSGSGSTLGFLAAANNQSESGTGTVYYTDGTTSTYTLNVGNFWYPAGQNGNPSNVQVAAVNYANYLTGSSGHTIYVFEQSVPIEAGKTVAAVALPALGSVQGYNPAMHVFAVSVGS